MLEWQPIILTLQLALVTTVLLLFIAVPLASWLAFTKSKLKVPIEALVSMPLVLPPTVLGFYLLLAFSPRNAFGSWLDSVFDIQLVFSFQGLVIASIFYSLPFMVQPIQSGFAQVPQNLIEASTLLGKSHFTTLIRVVIPNARPAILSGIVLAFAHTIGEFGVVLMIGGNIPGVTRVASIAIYDQVQAMNYDTAHIYSAILFAICFGILIIVQVLNGSLLKSQGS